MFRLRSGSRSSGTHAVGQFPEKSNGLVPSHARIGDALPMGKRLTWNQALRSRDQIALQHNADDASVATGNLAGNMAAHGSLAGVIFITVGMTAVDHDIGLQSGFLQLAASRRDRLSSVIDAASATSQDHVTVGIAGRREDCRLPVLGVAEKGMGMRCG